MLSFKELQKLFRILICHDQGIINGEQLLFYLYCSYDSKNQDFPDQLYPDFNRLHDKDEDECLAEFRFNFANRKRSSCRKPSNPATCSAVASSIIGGGG